MICVDLPDDTLDFPQQIVSLTDGNHSVYTCVPLFIAVKSQFSILKSHTNQKTWISVPPRAALGPIPWVEALGRWIRCRTAAKCSSCSCWRRGMEDLSTDTKGFMVHRKWMNMVHIVTYGGFFSKKYGFIYQ